MDTKERQTHRRKAQVHIKGEPTAADPTVCLCRLQEGIITLGDIKWNLYCLGAQRRHYFVADTMGKLLLGRDDITLWGTKGR